MAKPTPEPYVSPSGYHRHRCFHCGTVWEHEDCTYPRPRAHQCPACGQDEYFRYDGPAPPEETTVGHSRLRKFVRSFTERIP